MTYILRLHWKYQTIGRDLSRLQCSELVFNNELKLPKLLYDFQVGDSVYYYSPWGKVGLSRKLTCRWSGPYSIVRTISSLLSVIFPAES